MVDLLKHRATLKIDWIVYRLKKDGVIYRTYKVTVNYTI